MKKVDPSSLYARVRSEIDTYEYEETLPGSTIGVPWSSQRVMQSIKDLESHLVHPYPIEVLIGSTEHELSHGVPAKTVWVVAEKSYIVFFDPETNEYGLADCQDNRPAPVFIDICGDLVYVWGAQ